MVIASSHSYQLTRTMRASGIANEDHRHNGYKIRPLLINECNQIEPVNKIEKAKRYTKALPISKIEKCPVPLTDPPVDSIMNQPQASTSRIYNEPVVRGQIPSQIPNIFPMTLMNMNSMPGVPSIGGLTPLVWNNPPNNQSIAQTPGMNVPYPQSNFQQPQEYPQSFPTHINEELDSNRKRPNRRENDLSNEDKKTHDTRDQSRNLQQKSNWNGGTPHLRKKLIAKRKNSLYHNPPTLSSVQCAPQPVNDASVQTSSEATLLYGRNEPDSSYENIHDKNKNTGVQMTTEETSTYDLSALKHLKTSLSSATCWLLVVDTEMLLKHFQFLEKITDIDEDFCLFVPDHVMKELHERVGMEADVQSHRILRHLSQQIEAMLAFKGNIVARNSDDIDHTSIMLATCEDLEKQNNVILLSNDVKYQRYKNGNSNVHILTLNELKQILNNASVQQATLRNKSPTVGIKIIVANNEIRDVVPTKQMFKTPDVEVRSLITKKLEMIRVRPVPSSKPDNNQITNENARSQTSEKRSDTDPKPVITPEPVLIPKCPKVLSNNKEMRGNKLDTSRPNIVIAETSSSGVISNTTLKATVSVCDDVNFETFSVVGQSMEEVLRTRREEWILRFFQIMEDTLKEILRVEPSQSICCECSPVSVTDLPELARCVIKKFSQHFAVVDAANQLSNKLHKISDSEGGNIEPEQYMDIYSFGVYLIRSLKKVTEDCEDLKTSGELLKKLLYDIHNANLDNENLADELNESVSCHATIPANSEEELPHVFYYGAKSTNTNSKGNLLLSREESQTQINKKPQQQNLTNIKTKFDLAKRSKTDIPSLVLDFQNMHSTHNTFRIAQKPDTNEPRGSPSPKTPQNSPSIQKAKTQVSCENNNDLTNSISNLNLKAENNSIDNKTRTPFKTCFVRYFNSIPQFEENLNKKGQTTVPNESLIEKEYVGDNFDDTVFADGRNESYSDNELDWTKMVKNIEDGEIEHHFKTVEDLFEAPNEEHGEIEDYNDTADDLLVAPIEEQGEIEDYNDTADDLLVAPNEEQGEIEDHDNNAEDLLVAPSEKQGEIEDHNNTAQDLLEANEEQGEIDDHENNAEDLLESPNEEQNSSCQQVNTEKFERFINEFIDEIRQSIRCVLILCIRSLEELQITDELTQEIQNNLRIAFASLNDIKNSICSTLESESSTPENNIILLLKQAKIDDIPSKELLLGYRNIISKCGDQVKTCHDKVKQIMHVAGIQPLA